MWTYQNPDELYHYGVLGMKWGHRKASRDVIRIEKRNAKADKRISKIEASRSANAKMLDVNNDRSKLFYKGKNLERSLALNKGDYTRSEVLNKYFIASQKAKKDKNYKKSTEYQKAKSAYGKQVVQDIIFGNSGSRSIEMYKNMGYSEKKAKGKVAGQQALVSLSLVALSAVMMASMNN